MRDVLCQGLSATLNPKPKSHGVKRPKWQDVPNHAKELNSDKSGLKSKKTGDCGEDIETGTFPLEIQALLRASKYQEFIDLTQQQKTLRNHILAPRGPCAPPLEVQS